jgi:hypothetical protein
MMSSFWVSMLLHSLFKRPVAARYTGKLINGRLMLRNHV